MQGITAIRARIAELLSSGFIRSVGVLAGGTALSQAISVLALPLLTRIYSPEHFSVLAVFSSMLGIASVAACLRFEFAIPLPEKDSDAANLLALALCSAAAVAALLAVGFYVFTGKIISITGQEALRPYLWIMPLGVWLSGTYAALQFWSTRRHEFSAIAKTRLTQALTGTGAQLGMGFLGVAPLGLLVGQVLNNVAGVLGLGREALHKDLAVFKTISLRGMGQQFRVYDRFPKYSTVDGLANALGSQAPMIIIAALALGPEAGYLMLATRAMAAPMTLIGSSVAQVYLSRAPHALRDDELDQFTVKVIGGLAQIGVGPLIFISVVAPIVFPFVFGKEWIRAGEIVTWMTPWFVMQFLASPISMVMHIRGRQKAMLALTLTGLAMRLGALYLAAQVSARFLSETYALSGGAFYLACFLVFSRTAGISTPRVILALSKAWVSISAWLLAAAGVWMLWGKGL